MNTFDFYLICLSILYSLPCHRVIVLTITYSSQIMQICIEINHGYPPSALFNMFHHFMFLPILQKNLELFTC